MKTVLKYLSGLFIAFSLHAQQKPVLAVENKTKIDTSLISKQVAISLKDGTNLIGILQAISAQNVTLTSGNLGAITIETANIINIKQIDGLLVRGRFWIENPHPTRYFWAPSAYSLRKGEGYVQNAYLFVNSVTYGATDHLTVGGGFVLNPTFKDWQILFINPKYSFASESKIRFAVGVFVVGSFSTRYDYNATTYNSTRTGVELNTVGIVYGNATIGTKEHNGSIGLGYGFANKNVASSPVVNLSYMNRFSKNVGFVSENWIASFDGKIGGLYSAGVRIFGERISVDLAGVVPYIGSNDFILIPYVDVVYRFGNRRK
jgi:hypothetical protein